MSTIISWTNETWNPTTGCSKVDGDCKHCYAERLTLKFGESWGIVPRPWTQQNASLNVICHEDRLAKPLSIKKPSRIFVNSMSDLFHECVPDAFIGRVFDVMRHCPQHTFQILTKRPERAATWRGPWTGNIWMGTSVGHAKAKTRIDALRPCGAKTLFLSCEPLWEPLGQINLSGYSWVIVGGESGLGFRPMDHAWAREIRDQCVKAGVAFFFKQSAAIRTEVGTELEEADGTKKKWQEYPEKRIHADLFSSVAE